MPSPVPNKMLTEGELQLVGESHALRIARSGLPSPLKSAEREYWDDWPLLCATVGDW